MRQGEQLPSLIRFLQSPLEGRSSLDNQLELQELLAAFEHRARRCKHACVCVFLHARVSTNEKANVDMCIRGGILSTMLYVESIMHVYTAIKEHCHRS